MKLSNPKGKWTLFMKKRQLQLLGGSFNGIWMDASGQYFEHFAPKNTGFPVGCNSQQKIPYVRKKPYRGEFPGFRGALFFGDERADSIYEYSQPSDPMGGLKF